VNTAGYEDRLPDPKVLFITGRGRSGSTILDNLLGQLDGFFSLGQVNGVWGKSLRGELCGCGATLRECEVWAHSLSAVEHQSAAAPLDPREISRWQQKVMHRRTLGRLLRVPSGSATGQDYIDDYASALGRLYRELARVTGARVLVDSSKFASHGAILRLVPGIRPYFLHLVRDPRAVAYSRQRHKDNPGRDPMPRLGPWHSGWAWLMQNLKVHQVLRRADPGQRARIRYEDFVGRPLATLQRITELVGEAPPPPSLVEEGKVWLSTNHTAAGNPSRFKTGRIELRSDDEWLRAQKPAHRAIVTGVSLPLLVRYRYPVLPAPARPVGSRERQGAE
jgi:hypothetical protein